jgi:ferredoxin
MESTFQITFEESKKVLLWDNAFDSLLSLALANGIDHPYSCRVGTCSTCLTKIENGDFHYEPEPFIEVEEDMILLCCAKPDSDLKLKA